MLKPEILDPQGQAIANALPSLGFSGITTVRQGKRFEVEVDGDLTDEALAEVTRVAGTLLSNPVIEDFAVRVEDREPGYDRDFISAAEPAEAELIEAEVAPAAEPSTAAEKADAAAAPDAGGRSA
jgi:phosphoribosylformylglycinamidine synthase